MGKFVNYKKRSVTLPEGCKDLLDVLQPSRRSKATKPGWVAAPVVKTDHFQANGLPHLGEYVSKLLDSASNFFAVMITHHRDRPPIVLTRNRIDNLFAVAVFDNEPSTRTVIKAFFVQEGVEPLLGHSGQVAIGASSLVYPLPLNASRATDLATGLLRTAYRLSDDAGLDFRYYEMDTPV